MWEKIKKFFKWIADHTGISWIARKISSGWKWLFGGKASATQQNTSQQDGPSDNEEHAQANGLSKTTTPKTLGDGPASDTPNQSTPPAAPGKSQEPVVNHLKQRKKVNLMMLLVTRKYNQRLAMRK